MHLRTALMGASASVPPGAILMAARTVEELQDERQELVDASQAVLDKADADSADVSDDDLATIEANKLKIAGIDRQIAARKAIEDARTPPEGPGRKTTAEDRTGSGAADGGGRRVAASPRDTARHGFRGFGEFAIAVRAHAVAQTDHEGVKKLVAAASTFGNEGTGADGGFLVPPEFATTIMQKVLAQENLLSRATELRTSRNGMTIPKDETTPWQASGGVLAYWENEGGVMGQTKPSFETDTIRLAKLTALVPLSEELLEDAIGLESWLRAKAPAKMAAKINTAFVRGTGVGQPLGMLNAPSLLSVAKETSQPAATVWFANVVKMWSRMYADWRRNSIWLINQDIEPQLLAMAFDPVATSKIPVYLPPGGLSQSPYGTLMGRPVVPIQACSTLGTQGDIILTDMAQYWALTKAGGIQTAQSIHLFFDQAITAFRFIFRLNGLPAWSAPIAPENGSNTLSWCVTLDTRS